MSKKVIFVIFLLLFVGLFAYIYFVYEKPSQKDIEDTIDLSIAAHLEKTPDKKIEIDYEIIGKNVSFTKKGRTSPSGFILEKIPVNYEYIIYGFSPKGKNYYSFSREFSTKSNKNRQIRLEIEESANLKLNSDDLLRNNKNLSLEIIQTSSGEYKNPIICIKESFHLIEVNLIGNYENIEKPSNYSKFSDCYNINHSFSSINSKKTLEFSYRTWANLDSSDFIKVVVLDRELFNNKLVSERDGKDIGGKNYIHIFKY